MLPLIFFELPLPLHNDTFAERMCLGNRTLPYVTALVTQCSCDHKPASVDTLLLSLRPSSCWGRVTTATTHSDWRLTTSRWLYRSSSLPTRNAKHFVREPTTMTDTTTWSTVLTCSRPLQVRRYTLGFSVQKGFMLKAECLLSIYLCVNVSVCVRPLHAGTEL